MKKSLEKVAKLQLHRETLRFLSDAQNAELKKAAGGTINTYCNNSGCIGTVCVLM